MISPSDDRTFPVMQDLLSWTSKRQQALASKNKSLSLFRTGQGYNRLPTGGHDLKSSRKGA